MRIDDKVKLSEASISKSSTKNKVPKQDLLIKFLIDSHQFTDAEILDNAFLDKRINTLAKEIKDSRQKIDKKYSFREITFLDKEKCSVSILDWKTAKEILKYYHHIGSYRPRSIHLGLYYEVEPNNIKLVGIATFSKYDFYFHPYSLFAIAKASEILNLSRFYLFGWAPPFATSHFLSKSVRFIRDNHPNIKHLITCINPNTGHGGSSFEASNWVEIAEFAGTPYLFLDKKYITVRRLSELFGTLDLHKLKDKLGDRLLITTDEILPQKMYLYILDKKLKRKFISSKLDKIFSFNMLRLSPEYGLTDKKANQSITQLEAENMVKDLGENVIAGFLEKYKNSIYSTIIMKTNGKLSFLSMGQKLKAIDLAGLSKSIIVFGEQITFDSKEIEEIGVEQKINALIVLSYQAEDINPMLNKIRELSDKLKIKAILFDYFHGFRYISI